MKIFVINPGSTSTKLAIFEGEECRERLTIRHPSHILDLPLFPDRFEDLLREVSSVIAKSEYDFLSFDALAARGGRLKPVPSGVYRVNEEMVQHARIGLQGQHPANLAIPLAWELSKAYGLPAFTVDPISVDELNDVARITGLKGIQRSSLSHALNMKAVARKAAKCLSKSYEEARLIVVHLGGGGSISAHLDGCMVDIYNSDQEGPFSIERAGALSTLQLLEYMKTNEISFESMITFLTHEGGLYSYFKTRDLDEIVRKSVSYPWAAITLEAYIYQIVKYVCSFLPIFGGKIDGVVFTGGVCYSEIICNKLAEELSFINPLLWYPGEFEMEALALGALAVLEGRAKPKTY